MENQEKDVYVKLTNYCKCGCKQHCGHSCLECDCCTECECSRCQDTNHERGYN